MRARRALEQGRQWQGGGGGRGRSRCRTAGRPAPAPGGATDVPESRRCARRVLRPRVSGASSEPRPPWVPGPAGRGPRGAGHRPLRERPTRETGPHSPPPPRACVGTPPQLHSPVSPCGLHARARLRQTDRHTHTHAQWPPKGVRPWGTSHLSSLLVHFRLVGQILLFFFLEA